MWFRRLHRLAVSAVVLGLAVSLPLSAQDPRGRKYKAPPPTSRVDVTILRNEDGKPIENAAVVFQLVSEKGNMELKTNEDGKTVIDVLPTGSKVTLQVIAKGFQTYGRDYTIDKPQMSIKVKLKRPGQQYSIYDDHSQEANSGQSPDAGKDSSPDKSADADKDKDASKDHPAESAKESESKPDTTQPQPQRN
jgi:hypothetical protein